ncbi:sporulation protein YunB [Paenibacillus septentrionalis]|uniref:Sporulation protein YunB n=1 Tax=Paenibacillus septentrionalis TaxID=429342 RepID=A0ABW1V1I0_9BACL
MARWGRKGLGWQIMQLFSSRGQRSTFSSASSWGKRKWLEQPASVARKKQQTFKARRTSFISWGRPFHNRVDDYSSNSEAPFFTESASRHGRRQSSWKRGLLFILVTLLVMTIPAFVFVEKNIRQPLMHVAKIRIKQVATQAINGAITEQVAQRATSEELIDWKMDSKGKISGFMLNYNEHMRITSSTIETVQSTLSDLQHMPEKIPLGHALDSAIISTYGPKIPVTFEPLGAVKVELNTREKNAAINMVLVEVYIKVITEVAIIVPFDSAPEVVEAEIPISYLLVVGDVPMYYYDSTGKPVGESAPQAPNISVPLQPGQGISSDTSNRQLTDPEAEGANTTGEQQSSYMLTP